MSALQWDGKSLVDRRLFIADTIWYYPDDDDGGLVALHREQDPQGWERLVLTDDVVITQVDDGGGRWGALFPTCSSTAPWLMRRQLDALAVEPGMRVLEIGTGTGYNAAVLAEAGAIVTSVEIDPGLADAARLALDRAGYGERVRVVNGDGELGAPDGAPYDRVIVTASAHDVPYAWVEQTRDGGRIVLPYTGPHDKGALLVLAVWGGVAEGAGVGDAHFMPMRGQRLSQRELQTIPDQQNGTLRVRVTAGGQQTEIT